MDSQTDSQREREPTMMNYACPIYKEMDMHIGGN